MISIGFHDSGVEAVSIGQDAVSLNFEDVYITRENQSCSLTIKGIRNVLVDGEAIARLDPSMFSGEVLDLEIEKNALFLLISQQDYQKRTEKTLAINVFAECLDISIPMSQFESS